MDNKHCLVPSKCEEAWFDVAKPCGKEFELPNISSPMSPNNLLFSQYQQLDAPAILESAFVLDTNNLSSAENQLASSPIMEMVPPMITNTVPVVNCQEDTFCSSGNSSVEVNSFVPIVNHQIHLSRFADLLDFGRGDTLPLKNQLVHVPNSTSFSWDGLDINFSLSNRQFHAVNSTNMPCVSSARSLCLKTHPTHAHGSININTSKSGSNNCFPTRSHVGTPSKTSEFSSNNCIINNLVHFPISRWAHVPVMTNSPGNRVGESCIENGLNHLQNCGHRTRTMKTVSFPRRNQLESPATQSYYRGRIRGQQTFGPSSLQVVQTSSDVARKNYIVKYVCKDCDKEFPSYSAFGGHMSFHARTRKMHAKLSSRRDASRIDSLEITDEKIEGNNSPNETKRSY